MNFRTLPEMEEATRLTRLGKVQEATALIQKVLSGNRSMDQGQHPPPTQEMFDAAYAAVTQNRQARPEPQPAPKPQQDVDVDNDPHHSRRRTSLRESIHRLAAISKELGLAEREVSEPLEKGASFTAAKYANSAGSRSYKLYVPAHHTAERLPLIIMMHGCTQSPDDFAAGTRMNAHAEEHGFLVAYPAQKMLANARHCWNWFNTGHQRRGEGEPSIIAGITEEIARNHPVDRERIYIAGLSAGGAAAAVMADAYPDVYAAIGVHSGLPSGAASNISSAFDAMRMGTAALKLRSRLVPTIVFHGDDDDVVHPANGDAVANQAISAASALAKKVEQGQTTGGRSFTHVSYADETGRTVCEQWTVKRGGHRWAGGCSTGSHTDPKGPDASKEMLRFFFQHKIK
jgi:poly(hydroxyalkanoate) depolymerase family esterase